MLAGPDRARQDRRRRAAARGVRRPRRDHGSPRAGRPGLPGRHAGRESARDRRRALGPAPAARPRRLRRARARGRPFLEEGLAPFGRRAAGGRAAHALHGRRAGAQLRRRAGAATPSATARSSGTCSSRASTSRRRSSRRSSPRPRTATRRSSGRSRRWRALLADVWETMAVDAAAREHALGRLPAPGARARPQSRLLARSARRATRSGSRRSTRATSSTTAGPRLFAPPDDDTALLLGDYLYAHGVARISALHDVAAVADLSELISLCSQVRAEESDGDGPLWAATAALLGRGAARRAADGAPAPRRPGAARGSRARRRRATRRSMRRSPAHAARRVEPGARVRFPLA